MEISSSQERAAMIFNVIPMFLILASFIAGMQISTDSRAGERERGSPIPFLRQFALGTDIGAKVTSPLVLVAAAVLAMGVAALFLWLATRLFSDEKISFGR